MRWIGKACAQDYTHLGWRYFFFLVTSPPKPRPNSHLDGYKQSTYK